jgi:hypothetical protein
MAMKVWNTGDVLSAADLDTWAIPRAVVKPTDESVTSSTTLQADNDLVLPVDANGTYRLDMYLDYEAASGGDLKMGFTFPAGLLMRYHLVGTDNSGNPYTGSTNIQTSNPIVNGAGAAVLRGASFRGTVVTTGTAGNLTLTWAQNASNATSTIVHQYSHMMLTRLA